MRQKPKYRIVRIRDDYPWQIQRRVRSVFWQDTLLGFSKIQLAKEALEILLSKECLFIITTPRLPKYRIIKIPDVCPWQIQERVWLVFWRDKYLSFSSIQTAKKELEALLPESH